MYLSEQLLSQTDDLSTPSRAESCFVGQPLLCIRGTMITIPSGLC